MKYRVLPVVLASALLLAGCATGGPTDVAVIGGKKIGQDQVENVLAGWQNDPLYNELVKAVGKESVDSVGREAAQQTAANRAIITLMADKYDVTLPDDAKVEETLAQQVSEVGGLEELQKQIVQTAQQSGMAQGLISLEQLRDQMRSQLSIQAVAEAIDIPDAEADALLTKSGLPAENITEEIRDQARQQLRQQRFEEELSTLNIKINPRLNAAGQGVLGQTIQSPNGSQPGGGAPVAPPQGGQPIPNQPEPPQPQEAQPQDGQPLPTPSDAPGN
ncbi:hypothetical protein [Stomatohabitans albus]|uniref:hypothetical protein n=1 Tax=Stomatohabitans albus TaxID=3110766 RepID=UPI00300CC91F